MTHLAPFGSHSSQSYDQQHMIKPHMTKFVNTAWPAASLVQVIDRSGGVYVPRNAACLFTITGKLFSQRLFVLLTFPSFLGTCNNDWSGCGGCAYSLLL